MSRNSPKTVDREVEMDFFRIIGGRTAGKSDERKQFIKENIHTVSATSCMNTLTSLAFRRVPTARRTILNVFR